MRKISVLLADNDPDALATYAEFLTSVGYRVLTASSPAEARSVMETRRVHLAVFDLRLVNDDDEKDRSGLNLARESPRVIPKLILTRYPTYQAVRDALRLDGDSMPPAIDFLDKHAGLEPLGEAIRAALEKHVHINAGLAIQTDGDGGVTFSALAAFVAPGLQGELLLSAAEELEDLFRDLFFEKTQVNLSRLLWRRGGRLALKVFAFAEGKAIEPLVVVCGGREAMREEARRYREYAPRAVGHSGTVLSKSAETYRFGANAYALAETDLENVSSLAEAYHMAPEKNFHAALGNLYQVTLAEWQQGGRIPLELKSLAGLYRERLGLGGGREAEEDFAARVRHIVRQMPTLGVEAAHDHGQLSFRFGGQVFTYPDPTRALTAPLGAEDSVLAVNAPGHLSGENVLSDPEGRVWLTDFADAGPVPTLWNFVTLEAAVRFDWAETKKVQWLHEMELLLAGGEFNVSATGDVEPPLRKAVRAIRLIRQLASRAADREHRAYNVGLLLMASRRLADFDPSRQLTAKELARLAHLLIAAAMLYGRVSQAPPAGSAPAGQREVGIRINQQERAVWVNGERVSLSWQSYNLLLDLYQHANELCSRRALVERVFGETYDESDESQINRLNTAISRLREKIERDRNRPQFLFTEPHGGYKLVPKPQAK